MRKRKIFQYWKHKRRLGFHFYTVLYSMIVVLITVSISSVLADQIEKLINQYIEIPNIVLLLLFSLIFGILLSIFLSLILMKPINKIKELMKEVGNGNLNVKVEEKHVMDEIEDMLHYFNVMMNELRATETIQSDFISNVSHEFKTPLNAIDGYATLLSNNDVTEDERKFYVEKILFNVRRMNDLISNILLLSKIDNQSIDYNKSLFSLDEQIRQSILFLEPKWSIKNIDFDVDLDSINYYGNLSLMFHVWNNLIGNAVKFSPNNSTIKLSLSKEDQKIKFVIEDKGPGIKEEDQKHIFNKFYQADSSHKSEGNGLGLSLVKKIIDLANGQILVENLENAGCRFTVIL